MKQPKLYKMKKYIIGIWMALLPIGVMLAQTDSTRTVKDTKRELRRQRVAKRNLHYNILGGPSYTPDFGFLVGGSALMTFRMNPSDTTQRRSVVPMSIALIFNGGLNLMTKPQLFFKGDRFRIFGTFSYKNTIENFYGIGYNTNKDYPRGEDTSEYRYSGIQVNPWFLFRLGESDFFAGPQVDLNYDKITKPAAGMVEQPSYIAAGGTEHGYTNFSSGLGFLLTYDTRDVPANAYRGTYLDFRGMMYSKAFGGDDGATWESTGIGFVAAENGSVYRATLNALAATGTNLFKLVASGEGVIDIKEFQLFGVPTGKDTDTAKSSGYPKDYTEAVPEEGALIWTSSVNGIKNEEVKNLFDDNWATKFCQTGTKTMSLEFTTAESYSEPLDIKSFTMTTGYGFIHTNSHSTFLPK